MTSSRLVYGIKVTRKLALTLMRFGIIEDWQQLNNFNLDRKKFFSLYECKEFIERCYKNGWL